jgi:uncharacterized protein
MKTIRFLMGITCILFAGVVAAQISPVEDAKIKRDEISKLLQTTQALTMSRQIAALMVPQITGGVRSKRPDIPETALDFLPGTMSEIMQENEKFFEDLFVQLYDRHFTLDEIRAVNVFYETPAGKKMIEKQPVLMQQGAGIGAEWGRRVGPEIDRRVREKLAAKGFRL